MTNQEKVQEFVNTPNYLLHSSQKVKRKTPFTKTAEQLRDSLRSKKD
mgnify:CR=1 FL=1